MYDYSYTYTNDYYDAVETASGLFAGLAVFTAIMGIISIACGVLQIVSMWKMFNKAGKPGWAAIVPVYNFVVLIETSGLPLWYIALLFIPFANIYAIFKINIEIAHRFGKSTGFGVGATFFPFIFYAILGLGKATYSATVAYAQPMQQQPMYNQPMQQQPVYTQPVQQQATPVQPQPSVKICPTCSGANPIDAQFCGNCGNRI